MPYIQPTGILLTDGKNETQFSYVPYRGSYRKVSNNATPAPRSKLVPPHKMASALACFENTHTMRRGCLVYYAEPALYDMLINGKRRSA